MSTDLREQLQATLGASYVLERELGGGGMSRVFVARETALDRLVVIKVLPPELAAGVNVERFRREIALAARLHHPHIVPLLAAGETNGLPYFTMPFIDGESLRTTLERTGELPINVAVRYLREVASALAYAHANGVVHRDIKPDNILVTGGAAVVTDFGVAKAISNAVAPATSGQLTGLGVALGTPAYMAPEQAAADPTADARADIYAFGATAYELLTGQPPFAGRAAPTLMAAHAVEQPEPVDRRRPAIPPPLAALVMQSLEKRPADRPQSAAELVQILDNIPLTSTATSTGQVAYRGSTAGAPPGVGAHIPRAVVAVLAAVGALAIVGASLAIARDHRHAEHAAAHRAPRLVVLPFQNEGPASDAYFADGLTEAITNRLASLHNLGVIDPRSADQFKDTKATPRQIGRDLGVQYILEGTVRWATNAAGAAEVQISPTLVNASDETTKLAPGPYVVQPSDVFRVQTDVATKVADALGVVLQQGDEQALTRRATRVPAAYDAYLRGRGVDRQLDSIHVLSPALLQQAIADFQRATTLDPKFALALAALGQDEIVWSFLNLSDTTRRVAARVAIDSALHLDPTLPEAHVARARYLEVLDHDELDAYEELVRAQAERPNDAELLDALGDAQVRLGRPSEGLPDLERAVQLDPRSIDAISDAAQSTFRYRQYDAASGYAAQLERLSPQDWQAYALEMQIATEGHGDTAAARRVLERERQAIPNTTVSMFSAEEGEQGPSDWPRLEALQLADLHPEQLFDTVNFLTTKMDLYVREHAAAKARAYADSTLRFLAQHSSSGVPVIAAHQISAYANAVAGRGNLARAAISAIEHDGESLQGQNSVFSAHQAEVLAGTFTVLGEADSAIAQIARILTLPSGMSPSYFRVDPEWDALRSQPSFQRVLSDAGERRDTGAAPVS